MASNRWLWWRRAAPNASLIQIKEKSLIYVDHGLSGTSRARPGLD